MNRVIIDCDPGIDDAVALLLACGSDEIELLGVTTVAGNRPLPITSINACRILDTAGRHDVPVFAGCARPLTQATPRCNDVHGDDGLGGALLSSTRAPLAEHASDYIARMLLSEPAGTLTLIAVGPLTNLALAEIKHPGILARARSLLVMGGAAFCPGNVTPSAEFNFYADPLAAQTVMAAGADLQLFPLDVTNQTQADPAWTASFAALGTRCGDATHTMLLSYAKFDSLLHDACPVAWLLDPTLCLGQACSLSVDWRPGPTEGLCIAWPASRSDRPGPINATVFTRVHRERLLALVHERIARLP